MTYFHVVTDKMYQKLSQYICSKILPNVLQEDNAEPSISTSIYADMTYSEIRWKIFVTRIFTSDLLK